jgi:hypothetical protein
MSQEGREPDPATRTEGETLDMPEGMEGFAPGQVLGERYQILEMLGRGGMGEVWHAFDLKLRVEVALKALRPEFFKSERRLELLRQEVRAAREVMSPNVCRIFDLIEIEGRELVSMEYVDGATLLGVLQERGPLELKEAQDIASQFLAGLEHRHRCQVRSSVVMVDWVFGGRVCLEGPGCLSRVGSTMCTTGSRVERRCSATQKRRGILSSFFGS